jgi:hypothetical protein
MLFIAMSSESVMMDGKIVGGARMGVNMKAGTAGFLAVL